jgi:hypothetical protein
MVMTDLQSLTELNSTFQERVNAFTSECRELTTTIKASIGQEIRDLKHHAIDNWRLDKLKSVLGELPSGTFGHDALIHIRPRYNDYVNEGRFSRGEEFAAWWINGWQRYMAALHERFSEPDVNTQALLDRLARLQPEEMCVLLAVELAHKEMAETINGNATNETYQHHAVELAHEDMAETANGDAATEKQEHNGLEVARNVDSHDKNEPTTNECNSAVSSLSTESDSGSNKAIFNDETHESSDVIVIPQDSCADWPYKNIGSKQMDKLGFKIDMGLRDIQTALKSSKVELKFHRKGKGRLFDIYEVKTRISTILKLDEDAVVVRVKDHKTKGFKVLSKKQIRYAKGN